MSDLLFLLILSRSTSWKAEPALLETISISGNLLSSESRVSVLKISTTFQDI